MPDRPPPVHRVTDACEVYGWPGRGSLVFTCEHASPRLPPPLAAQPDDLPWLASHWASDIGAREITIALTEATGSAAVLSRVCRLACDVNRAPDDPTLIRARAEHHLLGFNELLVPAERARRIEAWHRPFHEEVDALVRARLPAGGDVLLLSIHTFPPALYGLGSAIDVGILYDPYEALAERLAAAVAAQGLRPALNQPHSGRRGHMYSPARHGLSHQVLFLELEISQALLSSPDRLTRTSARLAAAVGSLHLRDLARA